MAVTFAEYLISEGWTLKRLKRLSRALERSHAAIDEAQELVSAHWDTDGYALLDKAESTEDVEKALDKFHSEGGAPAPSQPEALPKSERLDCHGGHSGGEPKVLDPMVNRYVYAHSLAGRAATAAYNERENSEPAPPTRPNPSKSEERGWSKMCRCGCCDDKPAARPDPPTEAIIRTNAWCEAYRIVRAEDKSLSAGEVADIATRIVARL
jgi:hypothetical protein